MRSLASDLRRTMAKLSLAILGLVIVGTPLVAYLWQTLNRLLSGHFDALRVAIAIPLLALLILLLTVIANVVGRLDTQHGHTPQPPEESKP